MLPQVFNEEEIIDTNFFKLSRFLPCNHCCRQEEETVCILWKNK